MPPAKPGLGWQEIYKAEPFYGEKFTISTCSWAAPLIITWGHESEEISTMQCLTWVGGGGEVLKQVTQGNSKNQNPACKRDLTPKIQTGKDANGRQGKKWGCTNKTIQSLGEGNNHV